MAKDKILIGLDRYPEFTKAVKEITRMTINAVHDKAAHITSEMPYKRQFLLEEVITQLQSLV